MADSIGGLNWIPIGSVTVGEEWKLFPDTIIGGETFRLTYSTNWEDWDAWRGYRSYGLVRFYYPTLGAITETTVTPSFRVYPKKEKEVRYIPIPEPFKQAGFTVFDVGARGVLQKRIKHSTVDRLIWTLSLEYI